MTTNDDVMKRIHFRRNSMDLYNADNLTAREIIIAEIDYKCTHIGLAFF